MRVYLLYPFLIVQQQQLADAVLLLQHQREVFDAAQRKLFLQCHHDVLMHQES